MTQTLRHLSRRLRRPPPPLLRPFSSAASPPPPQTLAFEEVHIPPDRPFTATAFVLHGLMGAARNWRSFSRNLASELHRLHPHDVWRLLLLDLRNHGKSTGIQCFEPPHDMKNAAKDMADLVKFHGWESPDVVIAHSMGGKVALDYVESCARGDYGETIVLPKQLWVLDSVPGEIKTDYTGGEVEQILQILQDLPSSFSSRKWVVEHFRGLGYSKATADWIGSNLKLENGHYVWVFDLQATIDMFNSYWSTSYWSLVENPPKDLEIAIVKGENSDRWTEDAINEVSRLASKEWGPNEGKVSFHVLPKAGHWVHVDNPKGLLDIMVPNFYSKGG